MNTIKSIKYRYHMIILFVLVSLVTVAVMIGVIFFYRVPLIEKKNQEYVRQTSDVLSRRTETMLDVVLEKLRILTLSSNHAETDELRQIVEDIVIQNEDISAIILLDQNGKVITASIDEKAYQSGKNLIGNDFSYNPLYVSALESGEPVWSDKYVSVLAGDTTIGVAVPTKGNTAIAELSLDYLLKTIRLAVGLEDMDVWVLDRRGEVVADTQLVYTPGVDSLMSLGFVRDTLSSDKFFQKVRLNGTIYNIASSRSEVLGWTFISRIPSGLAHQDIYSRMMDMVFLLAGQILIVLLITPIFSNAVTKSIGDLTFYANEISRNYNITAWVPGRVKEFNELAENIRLLFDGIQESEESLKQLNYELEQRVIVRTRELHGTNRELEKSLRELEYMKDELVEAEKLSALGSLVAGVAHELNTPLGNALMAVTTMVDSQKSFLKQLNGDLTVSALNNFVEDVGVGLEISQRNLEKSAELVRSFKQVAVDQTSSRRRVFSLDEMLSELLLTLQPLTKRSSVRIIRNLQIGIQMNSYPGVLGQIITNLITNAVEHGFPEDRQGEIFLLCEQAPDMNIVIKVQDNGVGIPGDIMKKIFEPFFTTKQGMGGTGLGLSIASNGAKKVLGGTLEVKSEYMKGTTFTLTIPSDAPVLTAEPTISDTSPDRT